MAAADPEPAPAGSPAGVEDAVPAYAALLRGVNVGKAKRVSMPDLRAVFTSCGFLDVATLLQSGNVVGTTPDAVGAGAVERLEAELLRRTGVSASILLLAAGEVRTVATENPLVARASDDSRLVVSFLSAPPDSAQVALPDADRLAPEALAIGTRAVYQWCPDGVLQSKVPPAFWRQFAPAVVTGRNWRTVTKLLAMLEPLDRVA